MKKLSAVVLALTMLLICLSPAVGAVGLPSQYTPNGIGIFVSPSGNDASDGSFLSPLATIEAAKDMLRQMKDDTVNSATVYLRGGTYYLSSALEFTDADMPNVTYTAYEDEEVTISGARAISGFTEENVNGVTAFTKQFDEGSDITAFNTLYHPTETITTPRYPETGAFTVKDVDASDNLFTWKNTFWEASLGNTSFNAYPDDIGISFTKTTDMYVRIVHRWLDEISHVTYYETDTGKVGLGRPASAVIENGDEYWFENVFEELNVAGEWYLDTAENKLYYVPFEGENTDDVVLYAGNTTRLLTVDGCDGLTFSGTVFRDTEWTLSVRDDDGSVYSKYNIEGLQAAEDTDAAFIISNADNITFTHCDFINIGNSAVQFLKNVHSSSVADCYFKNIGSTAVRIKGQIIAHDAENSDEIMSDLHITNNYIEDFGQNTYEAVGVFLQYAENCEIANNDIHNGFYTGISCGWMWSHDYQLTNSILIKDNLIYNIGQGWLGDLGGIYTLGEQQGTVISGNVIFNVICGKGKTSYGGNGIYCDAGSSYMTIENNLVYDCTANGISISDFSNEQLIRNNIIALCNQSVLHPGYTEGDTYPCEAINNLFVSDDAVLFLNVKDSALKESDNILWDNTNKEEVFFSDGYSSDLPKTNKIKLKAAQKNGYAVDDTITDPLFTNLDARDFTLKAESPAFSIGFVPWDIENAGTIDGSLPGAVPHEIVSVYSQVNDLSHYDKSGSEYTWFTGHGEPLCVSLLMLAVLLLLLFAVVRLIRKKKVRLTIIVPIAIVLNAVALCVVFSEMYTNLLYGIVSALLFAEYGIYACLCYREKKRGKASIKGSIAVWLIGTIALLAPFYGLIYYLNNIVKLGSIPSVLISEGLVAIYCIVTGMLIRRYKHINKIYNDRPRDKKD